MKRKTKPIIRRAIIWIEEERTDGKRSWHTLNRKKTVVYDPAVCTKEHFRKMTGMKI